MSFATLYSLWKLSAAGPERGCVEDQPQHVADTGERGKGQARLQERRAAAGRQTTQPRSALRAPSWAGMSVLGARAAPARGRHEREQAREFLARPCNPEGIVSFSPGLRGTSYPGSEAEWISTPTGLRHACRAEPQPRWGCLPSATFPKVARSSQPWALGRNPFGIQSLVAQICNLPYRRFSIGRASEGCCALRVGDGPQRARSAAFTPLHLTNFRRVRSSRGALRIRESKRRKRRAPFTEWAGSII